MARAYFEQGEFELALRSVDGAIKLRGSTETSLRLKAAAAAELNQTNSVSVSITSLVHDYASSSLAPTYASLLGDLSDRSGSIDAQKFTTSLVESLSLDLIEMSRLDGEYLPILKVAPVYPRRAQTRGISGYCTVEYTVTKAGLISNPVAVDCFPEGVFERSSIKAAEQFKYAPRVVNGEPVEVTGVTNKFTYELEN
ncbi:MAG: hypothetical protein CML33_04615 [Rhodobacteraceae bacterium]|nr:hypothetical protein [Paracoccaceae bacterium]